MSSPSASAVTATSNQLPSANYVTAAGCSNLRASRRPVTPWNPVGCLDEELARQDQERELEEGSAARGT